MNLINNWLFQAIFANILWGIITMLVKAFIKWINTKPQKTQVSLNTPRYSKKTLRLQFYICLIIGILSFYTLLFADESSKAVSIVSFGWCLFLMISSFECSLESFEDINTKK